MFAFKGKDSFALITQSLTNPFLSYFEITDADEAQLSEKFLKIEDIKDLTMDELRAVPSSQNPSFWEKNSYEELICETNVHLKKVLQVDRSDWDEAVFKAWMNTGFNTVACPEFMNWVAHDLERNGRGSPHGAELFLALAEYRLHRKRALGFLNSEDEIFKEEAQHHMMSFVYQGVQLLEPGSDALQHLLNFGKSGTIDDVKLFFNSLNPPHSARFRNFEDILPNLSFLPMNTEARFALQLFYIMCYRERIHEDGMRFNNGLLENNSDSLEEAYNKWTALTSKNEGANMFIFTQLSAEHLLNLRIESLEQACKNFKEGKRPERAKLENTKFGLFMALRAYIGMRKYKDRVNVAELENQAKVEFGFASMPKDKSSLGLTTYMKNPVLHKQLSEYFLVLKYEKEWKSWKDVFTSMDDSLKAHNLAWGKLGVLSQLWMLLDQCNKGNLGHCKIDLQRKKLSCSAQSQLLAKIDRFKGEQAKYFQYMMEEGMKLNDLAKFCEFTKKEWNLVNSRMEESLIPAVVQDSADFDFIAINGPFPFTSSL